MEKIIFHKETKTFHLYNEEISYIMCLRKRTYGTIILWKKNS